MNPLKFNVVCEDHTCGLIYNLNQEPLSQQEAQELFNEQTYHGWKNIWRSKDQKFFIKMKEVWNGDLVE